MIENEFKIVVYKTAPYTSSSNVQVVRFHSTLQEIWRCLQKDNTHQSFQEVLEKSVKEYNLSVNSVTARKSLEIFFGRRVIRSNPALLEIERNSVIKKLLEKQTADQARLNAKLLPLKEYGEEAFVKINKRLGNKLSARYRRELGAENYNSTIKTKTGRIVHKKNLSNLKDGKRKNNTTC